MALTGQESRANVSNKKRNNKCIKVS
ncbi:hypothetical protein [Vibrio kanaloae]|nr:hypothetical protein F7Q89_07715 [Vibrio kanaloae]